MLHDSEVKPGGLNLAAIHAGLVDECEARWTAPICWWKVDPVQDAGAEQLLQFSLLSIAWFDSESYISRCYSSTLLQHAVLTPSLYKIQIHHSGIAQCSCPDFISQGSACKHLCAG